MKFSSIVPVNITTPLPVVEYLARRFTYHSSGTWTDLVKAGAVRIDGGVATPDTTVRGKQTVEYDAGEFDEPEADLDYSIIYEDEWLLAVNKPGNLLIHRAGRSFRNNLMYQLRSMHTPPYPEARSIHRLDRNTSGIVLVAKSAEVQAEIGGQFRSRTVRKEYNAIIEGIPDETDHRITIPIGPDTDTTFRSKFRCDSAGKEAVTLITACEALGSKHAHMLLRPLTGRTHQLRVHCSAIGHPIVGDKLYGSTTPFPEYPAERNNAGTGGPSPQRHALHCGKIVFFHTGKNKELSIEAPLPDDMKRLMKQLRKTK